MLCLYKKFLFLLWPPYEAYYAKKQIDRASKDNKDIISLENNIEKIKDIIQKGAPVKELLAEALYIQKKETERKNVIEQKATWLSSNVGVVLVIVTIAPIFLKDKWNISQYYVLCAAILYLLALVHFVVGSYYSIIVRRTSAFYMPSIDNLRNKILHQKWSEIERFSQIMLQVKLNEKIITQKSNYLVVVENLFLRGLISISLAAIVIVLGHLI